MIDGKELRKGNVVRCLVHLPIGFFTPRLPYTEITEIKGGVVETSVGTDKYKDIAPIALTPDIILRSGGKRITDNLFLFSANDGSIPNVYLMQDGDKYFLTNSDKEIYSIAIDSVHRLQNIYFALTGIELKIIL